MPTVEYRAVCLYCEWRSPAYEAWIDAELRRFEHEATPGPHDTWMDATPTQRRSGPSPPTEPTTDGNDGSNEPAGGTGAGAVGA